ncbi:MULTISPECIES: MFS transporter [unclassified Cupriavidus]|uniref:MFS transporter n=1 Tax=Cupriavidus sp. H19C3 TaxID=3241603 RepID=UPI003BF7AD03
MSIPARSLACLLLANILFHLPYNAGRATIQVLMLRAGGGGLEIGMVSALFALPMLLCAVPVGKWTARAGTGTPSRVAVAFLTLGLALLAALPMPYVFPVSATLIGTGYCIWYVTVNACIGLQSGNAARLTNFSRLSLSFALSSLLSGALVSTLDLHGWRAMVMGLLAGVLSGAAILAVWLAPFFAKPSAEKSGAAEETTLPPQQPRTTVLRSLYVAMLLAGVAWDAILFGLPFMTQSIGGTALLGACLSVFAGAAAFSRLCMNRLITGASVRTRILLCLATVASGTAAIGLSVTGPALVAAVALSGVGLGLIKPCISDAVCAQSPTASAASNLSVLPTLLALSAVVVPTAMGWLGAILPVFAWYLALAVAVLVLAAFLRHTWEAPRCIEA